MKEDTRQPAIFLVDRQAYWRGSAAKALTDAGFTVRLLETYNPSLLPPTPQPTQPQLLIMGCAAIAEPELQFIRQAREKNYRPLVFCASLTWEDMHAVFRAGGEGATEKSYDAAHLLHLVYEALANLKLPARNSYELVELQGLL